MPIQDAFTSCALPSTTLIGMDDWRENRQTCKGTAIKNAFEYSLNWFHADRFYEKNETTDIQSDNIDEGLSLATPKAWSIQANMALPAINYTFCNFIKDLSISPAGVLFI
jgi:ligand-binding SRPBCC domain-containing protein